MSSTTTVTDSASLNAALQHAQAGDTILLSAGTYSGLMLQNLNFTTNVTIASADPTHAAVITDMNVKGSTGLTFANLTLSSDPAIKGVSASALADPDPFRVTNSTNISFVHDSFHGSLDGNPADDRNGLLIDHSTGVTVTGSEFQQLAFGIVHSLSSDITITNNNLHDIRSDGIHGSSSNVTITGNYFHDFYPATGDHPDAVQFFNELPDQAPHDINVSDNLIVRGVGGAIEGIFLRVADNFPAKFANVTITGNTAVGTMYDGITVLGGQNIDIANNNLVSQGILTSRVWVGNSDQVTVANNQAGAFIYGSSVDTNLTPTTSNTHISTTGDTVTGFTTDAGASAVTQYGLSHVIPVTAGLTANISVADLISMATNGAAPTTVSGAGPTTVSSVGAVTGVTSGASNLMSGGGSSSGADKSPLASIASATEYPNVSVTGAIKNYYPFIAPTSGGTIHNVLGGAGADNLVGTSSNDAIVGGAGADTMTGGAGDDTYTVDNAGDKVVEAAGGGVDTVWSQIQSYTLPSNVEDLQLRGTGVQTGIGNDLNNYMSANTNTSSVLNGMAGNDVLQAGHGSDTLTGGAGADVFTFNYLPTTSGGVITDFTPGTDVLDLRGVMRNVVGYTGNNPIADGHLILTSDGHGGTNVMIDLDGYAGPKAPVLLTDLQHVAPTALSAGHDWIFA